MVSLALKDLKNKYMPFTLTMYFLGYLDILKKGGFLSHSTSYPVSYFLLSHLLSHHFQNHLLKNYSTLLFSSEICALQANQPVVPILYPHFRHCFSRSQSQTGSSVNLIFMVFINHIFPPPSLNIRGSSPSPQ